MNTNIFDEKLPEQMVKRLFVLVPEYGIDDIAFGRRIWDIAITYRCDILFVCAVRTPEDESRAMHRMANLLAVTKDPRIKVDSLLAYGKSWQQAIRRNWKPGDLAVCCPDQLVKLNLFQSSPMGILLSQRLKVPVYILSESYHRKNASGRNQPSSGKVTRV
jgi:hypothetical protein